MEMDEMSFSPLVDGMERMANGREALKESSGTLILI
jgi:hypothetical protein